MTRTRVTGSEREGVVAAPLGREPFLLDFLLDPVPGDGRQPIDEEHAVEVVELVLDDLRLQSLRLEAIGWPSPSSPSMRSDLLRSTSAKMPGRDRQPSSSLTTPAALGDDGIDDGARPAACRRP